MTLDKAPWTNQDELSWLALDVKKLEELSVKKDKTYETWWEI